MDPTFRTSRLELRPTTADDIADLHTIYADRRAMRFMPSLPHTTVAQTQAEFETERARAGARYWTVREQNNKRAIGYVNFIGATRIPGLGYALHPEYWGRGYAVEACHPIVSYGFTKLGYDRLELWIDERNLRSLRVAQKLGFAPKGRIAQRYRHEPEHHVSLVYGALAAAWEPAIPTPSAGKPHVLGLEPVLPVHDVGATVSYYRDVLGFGVDFVYGDPPDHAAVWRGEWTGSTVTIQFTRVPDDRELRWPGYLYVLTDSAIDSLYEDYRSRDVDLLAAPTDRPWGMREFALRDINGQLLVFGTHHHASD